MISRQDLQALVDFQQSENLVLSVYLDTDLSRQAKERCRLVLRDKLQQVADKSLAQDVSRIERFLDYEYDWQAKGLVAFSCHKCDLWQAWPIEAPVPTLVFAAERPYLKPLTDLLDEYEPYGVILVDQEGARLFRVELGEIIEESESLGEAIKRHKQGGWSQATYQRRVDKQIMQNLKAVAEAATDLCKEHTCATLILAGADETLAQFQPLLPTHLQKAIIGSVPADMQSTSAEVLSKTLELALEDKHKKEDALVLQAVTAAAKGEAAVMGLADTAYATREGRVRVLVVEQGYEAPGALCENCGYVAPTQGQKCLFCGHSMRPVGNAVDLVTQKVLDSGGKVRVVAGNDKLAESGHIGALLRY